MPPNTAEAADALSSVRREKLIWFSLETYCSCETQSYTDLTTPGHLRSRERGLLQRLQPTATSAFGPTPERESVRVSLPVRATPALWKALELNQLTDLM
jgi:hypothetical protein